jgi:hypothetical protein
MMKTNGLSARAEKLAAMLNGKWTPNHKLVEVAEREWRLKHHAARKAMRRAVIELGNAKIGLELKAEPGPRGANVTFMRLQTRGSTGNTGISKHRSARSGDEIRAVRKGDSNFPNETFLNETKTRRLTEEMQENQAQVDKLTIH